MSEYTHTQGYIQRTKIIYSGLLHDDAITDINVEQIHDYSNVSLGYVSLCYAGELTFGNDWQFADYKLFT
jgi:hypothetical protein